jgi:hypothetical protein
LGVFDGGSFRVCSGVTKSGVFGVLSAADRGEFGARPANNRSATTNDPLWLRGVDGRSAAARRYRDVAIALAADLGGPDQLDEASKVLVRQAAALTVQVESLQTRIVVGEGIDIEQMTRLSNVLGRTLQRLGLKKPRARPASPLASHFSRPPERSASS